MAVPPVGVRTAIVHDWFQAFHGSERVVEAMRAGLFADDNPPDIHTFYAARHLLPPELSARIVGEAALARSAPFRQHGDGAGRWKYLFPLVPLHFARLDLAAYGLVISSSHTFAAGVRAAPGAVHVCYCHTPSYYAWRDEVQGERSRGAARHALRVLAPPLRALDRRASRGPDRYVANSEAVRERIQRFYGRDATVVHPPVDVDEFDATREKEPGRFLWVGRFVPHKQPALVVDAFRGLEQSLTMVGTGPLEDELRRGAPSNVEIVGALPRDELVRRLERASGFVHVGEEDFGIAMVEALAAGAPVVGLDRGGARDIVRSGRDGILVERQEPEAVREAVHAVGARSWNAGDLATRAREFSRERFLERFRAVLAGVGV